MKNHKNVVFFLIIVTGLILFTIFIIITNSNSVAKTNEGNLKEIAVGMPLEDILEIMGPPKTIVADEFLDYFIYQYMSYFGMSSSYQIYVSKDDKTVLWINQGL